MFKVCFLNEKHINLVFCAFSLTFFIAAFMSEVLVFSWPRIIKKIYVSIHSFFHGVRAITNFLRLNRFRPGIICGPISNQNKPYNSHKNCTHVVLKTDCLR